MCLGVMDDSSVWNETQMVTVDDGLYSVKLGAVTPLDAGLFTTDELYLGLVIDDEIISPRLLLTSVAFAMRADDAEHAISATNADYADSAGTATSATNTDFATSAGTVNTADSATNAGYAANAGNSDTVNGQHASAFAPAVHSHDDHKRGL